MSNIGMIIEERPASLGQFLVGRLLPFRDKRTVGPYIFIDHMGPALLDSDTHIDVPPHPHIGLSTLTYLFEGSIMHRDSLGTEMVVQPGAVNWMTAGRGVVHSERTPPHLRQVAHTLHGLQIWVALPKELEDKEPSFHHVEANALPSWEENNVHFRLIAGQFDKYQSPVPVYSPQFFIEIEADQETTVDLSGRLSGEAGLYILKGSVQHDGFHYAEKHILVAKDAHLCTFTMSADTKVYVFGGEPFPEERFIYWNFVSTSRHKIEEAKERWNTQLFDPVPGETEFVPLPEDRRK
jgi:redox-sensitive bicupin YhaK (pirin superfamily)